MLDLSPDDLPAERRPTTTMTALNRWVCVLAAVFALVTVWLVLPFARQSHDLATSAAALLHLVAGAVLLLPVYHWLAGRSQAASAASLVARGLLLVAGATGLGLLARAALGYSVDRPAVAFWAHTVSGAAAVALVGWFWLRAAPPTARRRAWGIGVVAALAVVAGGAVARPDLPQLGYDGDAYYRYLTATTARQAGNPHFPSPLQGPALPAGDADCGDCHPKELGEWQNSVHATAGVVDTYLATKASFEQRRGDEAGRWCEGCHTPERLTSGRDNSPQASGTDDRLAGVGCDSCHSGAAVSFLVGNGAQVRRLHIGPSTPARALPAPLRRLLVSLRPWAHRGGVTAAGNRAEGSARVVEETRTCASCHRVGVTVAQNGYRFLRGPDEYGEWLRSPFSGQSVMAFRAATQLASCQSCHMAGPNPHQFATRTAAPHVHLDLFAARLAARQPGQPERWLAPLEAAGNAVRPGQRIAVDVVITNVGVGHAFPGGFSELRDTWLEAEVSDARGRKILTHGQPDAGGLLRPEAHTFGLRPLDREGRPLRRAQLDQWAALAPGTEAIGAGESKVVRYGLTVPAAVALPLRLTVRLKQRERNAEMQAMLGMGISPVRVVAQDEVTFGAGARPARDARSTGERWYDYGVGLLLQGDLPRAVRAMRQAQASWGPSGADPWVGLGRTYLQEGDLLAARLQFEEGARRAPGDRRPQALIGIVYRRMGEYERALDVLLPLARRQPADAELQFNMGLAYLRTGRNQEAADAFTRILEMDPHDVAAHYNLWMSLQRLRRFEEARREEVIYRYLRPEEGVHPAVASYHRRNPTAAREAQSIHEHTLRPVAGATP